MNSFNANAQTSTPMDGSGAVYDPLLVYEEDEVAIGCECANPVLQIDTWRNETAQLAQQ